MDRRIKYTKQVLNDSLIHFLEKKELSKITVTELCKAADINRSTYYAHFLDPFDQMEKLKAELLNDLTTYIKQINVEKMTDDQRRFTIFRSILQCANEKRRVFQILLSENGDRRMQEDILKILGEKAFPRDHSRDRDERKKAYLLLYASNGCFGIFFKWLMDEKPLEIDVMAKMMADFSENVSI